MMIKRVVIAVAVLLLTSFTVIEYYQHEVPVEGTQPVVGLNLGNLAPEIKLKNPDDSIISLSSLRGKLVLLDFWASWCGPCRGENPTLVKAYRRYHTMKMGEAEGLAIYSVSLDVNKDAWRSAIRKDGLVWPDHVSDLMGWNSTAAAQYGINSIPGNFLLNEKGVIIKKNLRGEELLATLEKLSSKN